MEYVIQLSDFTLFSVYPEYWSFGKPVYIVCPREKVSTIAWHSVPTVLDVQIKIIQSVKTSRQSNCFAQRLINTWTKRNISECGKWMKTDISWIGVSISDKFDIFIQ